jgi:hypothetical protein
MSQNWEDIKEEINRETEKIAFTPPREVLKIFKYGIFDRGAGTRGQYFTTLVFAQGVCRALAYDCVNNLVYITEEESFNLEHLKIMVKQYLPSNAEFLGYCGLENIWKFVQEILDALDTLKSKEELVELINSLNLYLARMYTWVHHFFPWNIGVLFPERKPEEIREMNKLIVR